MNFFTLNSTKSGKNLSTGYKENILWTGEALFNILDNAVKDTPAGGAIRVSVQSWELYVKIDIADSGKGIAESRQGMIFKRFYREEEVHDVEGIGIGLYLAREIITMQGDISG